MRALLINPFYPIMEFAECLKKMGAGYGFHVLAPFPGTEVREQCTRYGIRILSNDWSRYHANRAVTETETVSKSMLDSIVEDWEHRYLEYLGDIDQRRKIGKATPEEIETLSRLEQTVCLYDLMMSRALETIEPLSPLPSVTDELKRLSELSSRTAGHPMDAVFETLRQAWENGHLISSRKNGGVQWKWAD